MLGQLTDSERLQVAQLLVLGNSVSQTLTKFIEQNPESYHYTIDTFYRYAKSSQFQEDKLKVHDLIKEEAPNLPLVLRGSRIKVLGELVSRLLETWDGTTGISVRDLVSLSAEIRQTLASLGEEASVYDSDSTSKSNPYEDFFQAIQSLEKQHESVPDDAKYGMAIPDILVESEEVN